jgi:hypothetical protein
MDVNTDLFKKPGKREKARTWLPRSVVLSREDSRVVWRGRKDESVGDFINPNPPQPHTTLQTLRNI